MKHIRLLLALMIFATTFSLDAQAESRHVYGIDASEFPTVKATLLARNRMGQKMNIQAEFFEVEENGIDLTSTVRIDSSRKADTPGVSILLFVDISNSMLENAQDGKRKFDWLKAGLHAFIDSVKWKNGTEVAMLYFCNGTFNPKHPGWLNDPALLHDNIDQITLQAGATNYKKAFLTSNPNPFDLINQTDGNKARQMVFISDGPQANIMFDYDDADLAIERAQAARVAINCIMMDEGPDMQTDWLIKGTGGILFETESIADNRAKFRYLAGHIQNKEYYQLVWTSPYGCDEASKNRSVNIKWYGSATKAELETDHNTSYLAPDNSLAIFNMSEEELVFGAVGGADTLKQITITNNGPAFNFEGVSFDSPDFVVSDWGGSTPPFEMADGESRILKITYPEEKPTVSKEVEMTFNGDFLCEFPTLKLISLCSSEITDESVDFETVMVDFSGDYTINDAFTNTTVIPLDVKLSIEGTDADMFVIQGGVDMTVNPGASINVQVSFAPTSTGTKNAELKIEVEPALCGGDFNIALSGEGEPNGVYEDQYSGASKGMSVNVSPNPASDIVNIEYSIPRSAPTKVELYDSMGRMVQSLNSQNLMAGSYTGTLEVNDIVPGLYFVRIQNGNDVLVARLVVAR